MRFVRAFVLCGLVFGLVLGMVLVVFWDGLDCPRIYTDAHGLGFGCSIQNRRVVDPIAFVWKGSSLGFGACWVGVGVVLEGIRC